MTDSGPIPAAEGVVSERTVRYSRVPGRNGIKVLRARLFLPQTAARSDRLLIWLHSGGFRSGTIAHPAHGVMGREFARHGVASAFIEYRLRTKSGSLSKQGQRLLPDLLADRDRHDFGINPFFTGSAGLSAVEDCIIFLHWLAQVGPKQGLGGRIMLGGSSAGAITVLNTLFLAPHLGIRLPPIDTAFVMSGAFAYPSFYAPIDTPILAQHRPTDRKVPIASIRHFAQRAAGHCTLLEHDAQPHGGYRRNRGESEADAIARLMRFADGTGDGT